MNSSKVISCALVVGGLWLVAASAHAEPANVEVCAKCHGADGSGAGFADVPIIAGTPASHLEEALYAYQDGARRCVRQPEMCATVEDLSEDEVIAFAEHYASMRRISSGEEFDPALAAAGERVHEEHCARCHVPPETEDVEDALGIPLHGQRKAYLRLALDAYRRGDRYTLVPAMALKLDLIDADDFEALINYYASYRP